MWLSLCIFFFLLGFEFSSIRTVFIKKENRRLKRMFLLFLIPWRGLGQGQESQISARGRRAQKYQVEGRFLKTRAGSTSERDQDPTLHATPGRGRLQTSRWNALIDHLGKLYPRNQGSQLVGISVPKDDIKPIKLLDSKGQSRLEKYVYGESSVF